MTTPEPRNGPRLNSQAVRQVSALVTAQLHTPEEQWRDDPLLRAAYADVVCNAVNCLPILNHLVKVLLHDLADAHGVPAADLWQHRALTTAAALYDEGGPRG